MLRLTLRPSRIAVAGILVVAIGIAVSSFTLVRAERANPDKRKTFTCSIGIACVTGSSSGSKTWGVYGISTADTAVVGSTSATNANSGVAGLSTATTGKGHGVYGRSSNGEGVYGTSSSSYGVYGTSSSSQGVFGFSSGSSGVAGQTTLTGFAGLAGYALGTGASSGIGIYGESADTTGAYPVFEGAGTSTETWLLNLVNTATNSQCLIDPHGTLSCTGGAELKNVRVRHRTSSGQHVLAYASESASATLEDVGTGHVLGGIGRVTIDGAFGSTIDLSAYHVFLTPEGDASLYVSQKTRRGFVVREIHGGRSTLDFDYRIVARPLDAERDRLPLPPPMQKPQSIHLHKA